MKFSNPGCRKQPVYKKVFDKEENDYVVKKVQEIDIYEYIQSSAGATDLAQLRAEYVRSGVLPAVDPSLIHGAPSIKANNIHEFYGLINGAKDSFESLAPAVQQIFGSADNYVKALLKGDANALLVKGLKTKKEEVPAPQPQPAGESETK